MKQKVLVVGCSFARGHGLKYEHKDPELWVNKLFPEQKFLVNNLSQSGANNQWIFLETMSELIKQSYDLVLVSWSAIPRFSFHVGLELYSVRTKLDNNTEDINLNNHVTISGKWLKSLGDGLRKIHNDHWSLLELVKYVNVLIKIQTQANGKIFFVNALGPWPDQYFQEKNITLPSQLTDYEKNLLQVETRDDEEIFQLYKMIHSQYKNYGGIQESYWLNLYNSLRNQQIDVVSSLDSHPGYQSQKIYESYLTPILNTKLV